MGAADSCRSIFDYLKTLEVSELDELYKHPPTCLIVFRELSELAKHLVLRLLFLEQTIPKSIVAGWVSNSYRDLLEKACSELSDLRVWHSIDTNSARGSWQLSRRFQESMKISLFGGGEKLISDHGSTKDDKHPKSGESLDKYASGRWDLILRFMVAPDQSEETSCTHDILLQSGLMKKGGSDNSVGITQRGFQFLLMDRCSQVLIFILHYFDYLRERQFNLAEALQFVFQLSFLSIGKSYPTSMLSDAKRQVLLHMRELGLAYQRKRSAPRFYVTRLALSLAFGSSTTSNPTLPNTAPSDPTVFNLPDFFMPASRLPTGVSQGDPKPTESTVSGAAGDSPEMGFILVETNFRLYAYTDSPIKTALLSLFSKIRVRYPNLVVADITRDSVREALLRGISANQLHPHSVAQIISFLTSNAHPDMLRQPNVLPPTLVDQIRLWELERERLFFQEGCLYEQFTKNTDFEIIRDFAKSQGFLLWECAERRLVLVSKAGHESVRAFWKQKRQ